MTDAADDGGQVRARIAGLSVRERLSVQAGLLYGVVGGISVSGRFGDAVGDGPEACALFLARAAGSGSAMGSLPRPGWGVHGLESVRAASSRRAG
ncbi:hypothetical protein GCM10010446_28150 [Streptomyces enissocaesilis]|uniref:Uncharacterized protein n=1 Tax=Streptomyces enissocaesilis TaxID=332589 RepID=A0ABN3X9Z3_9ACTN